MEKILITGDSYTMKSNITKRDFDIVRKNRRDLLFVKENGEAVFCVNMGHDAGISPYGCTFNSVSDDGYLMMTEHIPVSVEDKKEYVAAKIAVAQANFKIIEDQIRAGAQEIGTAMNAIKEKIEVL